MNKVRVEIKDGLVVLSLQKGKDIAVAKLDEREAFEIAGYLYVAVAQSRLLKEKKK
jgi:hypothetical protein